MEKSRNNANNVPGEFPALSAKNVQPNDSANKSCIGFAAVPAPLTTSSCCHNRNIGDRNSLNARNISPLFSHKAVKTRERLLSPSATPSPPVGHILPSWNENKLTSPLTSPPNLSIARTKAARTLSQLSIRRRTDPPQHRSIPPTPPFARRTKTKTQTAGKR